MTPHAPEPGAQPDPYASAPLSPSQPGYGLVPEGQYNQDGTRGPQSQISSAPGVTPQLATHYAASSQPPSGPPAPGPLPFGPPAAGPSPYGAPAPGQNPYGQPAPGQGPYPAHQNGPQPYGQPVYGQAPPGQNPYGQQQYGQHQYGQQPYGAPPAASATGGAVAAFVVAIVSFVICGIPVIGVIGGIVGLVLGISAMRKVSAGTAGGKGFAVAAIVIGAVAVLGGAGSTVAVLAATRGITSVMNMPFDGTGQDSGDWSPVDPEPDPGQLGSLLDIGSSADIGEFTATVTAVELDAAELAERDATEIDPDYQYVLVDLDVAYNGTTASVPAVILWPTFVGNDGFEYPAGACSAEAAAGGNAVLKPGESSAMAFCMEVPTDAVDGGSIALGQPNAADRAYWSSE